MSGLGIYRYTQEERDNLIMSIRRDARVKVIEELKSEGFARSILAEYEDNACTCDYFKTEDNVKAALTAAANKLSGK